MRMLAALGEDPLRYFPNPVRAREGGVLQLSDREKRQMAPRAACIAQPEATQRVTCGAKTRKDSPCRNKSEPGRRRCKFHGGKSTGPRTVEGKSRIAVTQKRRWADFRRNARQPDSDATEAFGFGVMVLRIALEQP